MDLTYVGFNFIFYLMPPFKTAVGSGMSEPAVTGLPKSSLKSHLELTRMQILLLSSFLFIIVFIKDEPMIQQLQINLNTNEIFSFQDVINFTSSKSI